jgi:hypothetical protein
VIVGDVDGSAIAAAERAFAAIPGGNKPAASTRGKVQAMDAAAVSVTAGSGSPAEIVVGFRSSEQLEGPEAAALDLWGGVCSRAARDPGCSASWCKTASSPPRCARSASGSRDGGLWAFAVTPAPHRIAEAAEAAVGDRARVPRGACGR